MKSNKYLLPTDRVIRPFSPINPLGIDLAFKLFLPGHGDHTWVKP